MISFMKIYTKTGDDGKTSLFDNSRVWKSNNRIMSYGAVDELNSAIGLVLSLLIDDSGLTKVPSSINDKIEKTLSIIQNDLFIVGSDLANPDMLNQKIRTTKKMTEYLEESIDRLDNQLSELTSFILPGGTRIASVLHLARTIARRAETHVVALSQEEKITENTFVYLNRLSDLLFVMARTANKEKNVKDIIWKP